MRRYWCTCGLSFGTTSALSYHIYRQAALARDADWTAISGTHREDT